MLNRKPKDTPSVDELTSRVNHLSMLVDQQAAVITRLTAELEKITSQVAIHTREIGTLAKTPTVVAPVADLESAKSARKLLAYIGREFYGKEDDTAHLPVRNALAKHPAFARAREKFAAEDIVITAHLPFLRYLATRMPDGLLRYAHIMATGGGQ